MTNWNRLSSSVRGISMAQMYCGTSHCHTLCRIIFYLHFICFDAELLMQNWNGIVKRTLLIHSRIDREKKKEVNLLFDSVQSSSLVQCCTFSRCIFTHSLANNSMHTMNEHLQPWPITTPWVRAHTHTRAHTSQFNQRVFGFRSAVWSLQCALDELLWVCMIPSLRTMQFSAAVAASASQHRPQLSVRNVQCNSSRTIENTKRAEFIEKL